MAASQSELKIPLINLPTLGTDVYSRHQGQAQARVHIRSDTLIVEAHCDSLEEVINMYEAQLNVNSNSLVEMTKELDKLTFWQRVWISIGKISSIIISLGLAYLIAKQFLSGWFLKSFQLIIQRIFKYKI